VGCTPFPRHVPAVAVASSSLFRKPQHRHFDRSAAKWRNLLFYPDRFEATIAPLSLSVLFEPAKGSTKNVILSEAARSFIAKGAVGGPAVVLAVVRLSVDSNPVNSQEHSNKP
jgi:hypothetical protein